MVNQMKHRRIGAASPGNASPAAQNKLSVDDGLVPVKRGFAGIVEDA
jgi:hypothetical protein